MSEGTHSTTVGSRTTSWIKMIGGTAILIAGAAVMIQIFRAEPAAAPTDASGKASLNASTPTLASVNGKPIPYDVVARECFDRIGKEVLENMINRTIIMQEMEKRNLSITEAELNQEVLKIAKRFNLPPDTWYQMLQAERDLSPVQYRRDVIWPMIALRKLAGEEIQVSESDMQRAFQRNYGPRVRVRMIMMDNFRRAGEVWEQAKRNPEEFERLARDHSIEPNSKSLGGSIPPISRYSGNADNRAVEDAAFRLKPNEISGLIQVGSNYVILKCEGHTKQVVTDISEVSEQLYDQLTEEKTQERIAQVFDNLKKQTRVDNYLTNISSGGNKTTQTGNYTNKIQQTGTTLPGTKNNRVKQAAGTVPTTR